MAKFQNILVVNTGGARSDAALTRAIRLARDQGADLTIAETLSSDLMQKVVSRAGMAGDRRAEARERLTACARKASDAGVQALSRVLEGQAWLAVVREVMRGGHDLVILAENDRNSLLGMLDSTVLQVVRNCPCPVWVVKTQKSDSLKRIVAAIGCAGPDQPLDEIDGQVVALAGAISHSEGCHLDVVRPWDFRGKDFEISRSELLPEMYRDLHDEHVSARLAGVERLLSRVGMNGSGYEVHLPHDAPDIAVSRFVVAKKVDLVVVGTAAAQGVKQLLSNDFAESLLARVGCSTLTVKPAGFIPQVEAAENSRFPMPFYVPQRVGLTSGTFSKRMR